jgi:hypothetical protein
MSRVEDILQELGAYLDSDFALESALRRTEIRNQVELLYRYAQHKRNSILDRERGAVAIAQDSERLAEESYGQMKPEYKWQGG